MKQGLFSLAVVGLVLGAASAQAQETVKIGGLFGTTGPQANFGVPYGQGLKLAVDEINSRGGIKVGDKTYKFNLTLADTKSDPAQAVAEGQRMLSDGVRIIFCCNLSAESVPVLQAALPAGAMFLSPNAAMGQFLGTPGRELLFKIGNVETGKLGSTALYIPFVVDKFKPKSAAILSPSDEAGTIYANSYKETLEANGVKVVALERYDHGATDFTPQLTNIKRSNPDLLVAGYSDEVRGIFRQARELGLKAGFAGTVGVSGAVAEGLPEFAFPAWTRYLGPEQKDPKIVAYKEFYEKNAGKLTPFSFWSISFYDWMHYVAQSMQAAGSATDLKAVGNAMRNRKFNGLVEWAVDEKGLGRQGMEGVYLKDGKVAEIRSIPVPAN